MNPTEDEKERADARNIGIGTSAGYSKRVRFAAGSCRPAIPLLRVRFVFSGLPSIRQAAVTGR